MAMDKKMIGIIAVVVIVVIIIAASFVATQDKTVKPEMISLEASPDVAIGDSIAIGVEIYPEDAEDKTVTWKSSDESIATVDNGVVTGIKSGTVTISATTSNDITASLELEVYAYAKILVEDQYGVYFWADGRGDTIADVLENSSATLTVDMSDLSYGKYINSVNGLAGTADYSAYWSVYLYKDGAWGYSNYGISQLKTVENPIVGLFYVESDTSTYEIIGGGPDKVDVPKVSDAKVWDGDDDGTVFCIQSYSGMYFYINDATGTTMVDRFAAATSAYNIQFEKSKYGISTLFGMGTVGMTDDNGEPIIDPATGYQVYHYWAQFGLKDGAWAYMDKTLGNTDASDYKQMLICYGDGGMGSASGATAPIYNA